MVRGAFQNIFKNPTFWQGLQAFALVSLYVKGKACLYAKASFGVKGKTCLHVKAFFMPRSQLAFMSRLLLCMYVKASHPFAKGF